jgi:hypothetical protein
LAEVNQEAGKFGVPQGFDSTIDKAVDGEVNKYL